MKKTTFSIRFSRETRFSLLIGCMSLFTAMQTVNAQTADYTATATGDINSATAWGITTPASNDGKIWSTGEFAIKVGLAATGSYTFNGGTLLIPTGGSLGTNAATPTLTLNNLILSGGAINTNNNAAFTLNFQDGSVNTLTLNSGSLVIGSFLSSATQEYKNCKLAGSGNILITKSGLAITSVGNVHFQSTVNMTGFTGVFTVTPGTSASAVGGILKISSQPASATFGVSVPETLDGYTSTVKGKFFFNPGAANTLKLASLNLGGTEIAPGTYTLAQLNDYGGTGTKTDYLVQTSTGSVQVVDVSTAVNPLVENKLVVVRDRAFQLNNSTISLHVYNSVGACIINEQNLNAGTLITMAENGVYFVRAKSANGNSSVQKILIK